MRFKVFVFALLFSFVARASDLDPWFGEDKLIHFGASAAMGVVGYGFSSFFLKEPWQRALAGSGFSLLVGSFKEVADLTNGSVASWRDMTWNIAGTAAGVGLSVGVDYLVQFILHESKKDQAPVKLGFNGSLLYATYVF